MCPSYRATRNEKDVTRGRANTLAARDLRPARPRCVGLRRDDGDAETLRLLQGLPPRMPDRRRHGQDEDRGAGRPRRTHGLSLRDRLVGYLPRYAGLRVALRAARQFAQPQPAAAKAVRDGSPASARAAPCRPGGSDVFAPPAEAVGPETAAKSCCSPTPSTASTSARISTPRCACWSAGGYRVHHAQARERRPAAMLRPHLPVRRPRRRSPRRTRPAGRDLRAVRRARRADRRPGAELPADAARRARSRCARTTTRRPSARTPCCSRSFWCARRRPAGCSCRSAPSPTRRSCTAIATRNPSARSSRSSRCCASIPGLKVETIESSCCGMAGAFGYGADTYDASMEMAELSLLPAVRQRRPGDAGRCRRHLLPAPDPRRRPARGASRRARAGDEPRPRRDPIHHPSIAKEPSHG